AQERVESADEAGAIELYEEVLEENPEQVDALWNLSVLYSQQGYRMEDESEQESNYNTADEYADRCLEAHPEKAPCHFAKALAIGRMAEIVGARDRVRKSKIVHDHAIKAVELDPEFSRSWHLLGVWHSEVANLGRKEKFAARTFFGGLPKGASNEKAEESFQKAMEMRPESILIYLDYARHFSRTGDKEKAIELLQRIEDLEPKYKDDPDHIDKALEMLRDLA
ncbi:MAG: tetratricopeptide repeat protein, partial [Balneolaceae bacterium]